MREWNLGLDDPYSLIIAADARFCNPSYVNDQIWRLNLQSGDPRAYAVETTYGLRARLMRIFPEFRLGGGAVIDPSEFSAPPGIRSFSANYIASEFAPFPELGVRVEHWVPESDLLAGRFRFSNQSPEPIEARMLLYAQLRPDQEGSVMTEVALEGATILAGQTADLAPILFMTGGAGTVPAPYPALETRLSLDPGESKSYTWVHAGGKDPASGLRAAREIVERSWDAEVAKLLRRNAGLLEVETGDEDWDLAFAFAQKAALNSMIGSSRLLPHPSTVSSRTPSQGHSPAGDGRDYDHRWEGQSVPDAVYNARQIMHAAPDLAKGVLRNYLAVQAPEGGIDSKPGLAGQRSDLPAPPLLASLALDIFQATEDRRFLAEVFEGLRRHLHSWFHKSRDRDQDGFPEWAHTLHSGNEDWPAFVRWRKWGQALDISTAETPDLAAYLIQECRSLMEAAQVLGEDVADIEERERTLLELVRHGWSEKRGAFQAIDRDLHQVVAGKRLGKGKGEFSLQVDQDFDPAVRVLIRSSGKEDLSHAIQVFIHGKGRTKRDRVERLRESKFQWFQGLGSTTTDKAYSYIERIEVRGLSKEFQTELRTADYNRLDLSGLLPLWAAVPDAQEAAHMVEKSIANPDRFWREYGLPISPASDKVYSQGDQEGPALVCMFWNSLVGEGLVRYGYSAEAAQLLEKLVAAAAASLRKDKAFYESYHADRAEGVGERDHILGAPPMALFKQLLGLRLISPRKIALKGENPFPWPVRIRWNGVSVRWEEERAVVTFPDGGQATVEGDRIQVVEQID